jgi:hypothetical protein
MSSHQAQQVQKLRRFLYQHEIPPSISLRIQRNALHSLQEQQRFTQEETVELLNFVSEPLLCELHTALFAGAFQMHPFFIRYGSECPQVLRQVSHGATSTQLVSKGDLVFSPGELPAEPKVYILAEGSMRYITIDGCIKMLDKPQWIAEAALWVPWMHRGELSVIEDCRIFTLEANAFVSIVGQFHHPDFDPRHYARAFVADLNDCELCGSLSDLSFDCLGEGLDEDTKGLHLAKCFRDTYHIEVSLPSELLT